MGRTIKIQLTAPNPDLIHEFRNFGEDVYGNLGLECEISMEEIDSSTSEFHLRDVRKQDMRAISEKVQKIAEKYRNFPGIDVCEVSD